MMDKIFVRIQSNTFLAWSEHVYSPYLRYMMIHFDHGQLQMCDWQKVTLIGLGKFLDRILYTQHQQGIVHQGVRAEQWRACTWHPSALLMHHLLHQQLLPLLMLQQEHEPSAKHDFTKQSNKSAN